MTIWQKHWNNTTSDPRMQLLLSEMGVRGYGIYWLISERLSACQQGAILQQQLVLDMRSRRLNSQYILQVINNYYLFETDEGGYVRHHPMAIGYMNAHTLHLLRTGQLGCEALCHPAGAVGSGQVAVARTPVQRSSNAQPIPTLYYARAREKKKSISFLKNEIQTRARERTETMLQEGKQGEARLQEGEQGEKWLQQGKQGEAWLQEGKQGEKWLQQGEQREAWLQEGKQSGAGSSWAIKAECRWASKAGSRWASNAESRWASNAGSREQFEELIGGRRCADGKPIPDEAPPRPSATAVWDAGAHQWLEL